MLLETLSASFRPARSTDSTDASYPTRDWTVTEPLSERNGGNPGVWDMGNQGQVCQNGARIIPYGTDTAAQTFLMRVLGWTDVALNGQPTWAWHTLGEFTCTLSTFTGAAGGTPDASHLVCDTISLVAGSATQNVSCEVVSPINNTPAHVMLNFKGVRKIEFLFALGGGAITANALFVVL